MTPERHLPDRFRGRDAGWAGLETGNAADSYADKPITKPVRQDLHTLQAHYIYHLDYCDRDKPIPNNQSELIKPAWHQDVKLISKIIHKACGLAGNMRG